MENQITHLLLLLLLLLIPLLHLLRRLRRVHHHLPPGSTGALPLIGETLQLISAYKTDDPEPFIDERVNRFGPIFTTHVFGEQCVFSADPETNRFILQNEGKLFEISYPSSICNLLGKDSLLLMKGSLHKRMHSLTMSFANSTTMRGHLLLDIDRRFRSHMASWPSHVVLLEEAKKITFSISMKQLISYDPCEWTENLRKQYLLVIDGFFSIPFPFFNTTYCRAIKARTKVVEALTLVVRQRRKESEGGEKKNDMLGALFEEDRLGDGRFSDDEIVDFLVALLVGGYETTSTTMTFCIKFLTETPLALAQLREEQDKLKAQKGGSEMLTWSDYKSMPFTQCVINETLRLANIIGGIFRRATSDVQFGEYKIPKGSKVFASFRAVHMNEDHFKGARTFNPWRWQSENRAVCPPNAYTPFGGGPRICPGYELARVSMSVFLHHMVTQFNWTPTEDDKLCFFPTTRTQKGYPIRVERRVVEQCK